MMNINRILGQNIRTARKARKISQERFAELLGIGIPALSKIECGKSFPKPETIEKIVDVLKIEPYMLFIDPNNKFDIELAYDMILKYLDNLKQNPVLFKYVYDFIISLNKS